MNNSRNTRKRQFRNRRFVHISKTLSIVLVLAAIAIGLVIWALSYLNPRGRLTLIYAGYDKVVEVKDNNVNVAISKLNVPLIDWLGSDEKIEWGGVQKNTVALLHEMVVATEQDQAIVYLPNDQDGGPLSPNKFWKARLDQLERGATEGWHDFFKDYLDKLLGKLNNSADGMTRYVILGIDVQLPESPGSIPPQLSSFIEIVQSKFNENKQGWAETYPNIDFYLWLSHSPGQKSYLHSDPEKISSIFVREFEKGLLGNLSHISPGQVSLDDFNSHLKRAVASSARKHFVRQSALLLHMQGQDVASKANVDLVLSSKNRDPGTLFDYRTRTSKPRFLSLWKQLHEKINGRQDWTLENPYLVQRASMLLLQLEQAWYLGIDESALSSSEIVNLLDKEVTIPAIKHSLYDYDEKVGEFDIELLYPVAKESDAEGAKKKKSKLDEWRERFGGNKMAMASTIWNSFQRSATDGVEDRPFIKKSELNKLSDLIANNTISPDGIPISELVFLNRLNNELPVDENKLAADWETLLSSAIRCQSQSNQFVSELSPMLTDDFDLDDRFRKLERERRINEDKMFANKTAGLNQRIRDITYLPVSGIAESKDSFEELRNDAKRLANRIRSINRKLVDAPHKFRFAIETVCNAPINPSGTGNESVLSHEKVADFVANWRQLSQYLKHGSEVVTETNTKKWIRDLTALEIQYDDSLSALFGTYPTANFEIDLEKELEELVLADSNEYAANEIVRRSRLVRYWPRLYSYLIAKSDDSDLLDKFHDSLSEPKNSIKTEGEPGDSETSESESSAESETVDALKGLSPWRNLASTVLRPWQGGSSVARTWESKKSSLSSLKLISQTASTAHFYWPIQLDGDPLGDDINVAINDLHAKYSNFQFDRLAQDFWGTPTNASTKRLTDARQSFVIKSLNLHNKMVGSGLEKSGVSENSIAAWKRVGLDGEWGERISDLERIGSTFMATQNWKHELTGSNGDDQLIIKSDSQGRVTRWLVENFENEDRFTVSIRTIVDQQFKDVRAATPDVNAKGRYWLFDSYKGTLGIKDSRILYLRGWVAVKELPEVQEGEAPPSIVVKPVGKEPDPPEISFAVGEQLERKKVVFLLDCSRTMGTRLRQGAKKNRMDVLRDEVKAAISDIVSSRSDLQFELVAFGASKKHKKTGNYAEHLENDQDPANAKVQFDGNGRRVYTGKKGDVVLTDFISLEGWLPMRNTIGMQYPSDQSGFWDVWQFPDTFDSNDFDKTILDRALDQLSPTGQTPLFAAMLHVMQARPNAYYFVLTDGKDDVVERRKTGRDNAEEDGYSKKWRNLSKRIEKRNKKRQTVNFNFSNAAGSAQNTKLERLSIKTYPYSPSMTLEKCLDNVFPFPDVKIHGVVQSQRLSRNAGENTYNVSKYRSFPVTWNVEVGSITSEDVLVFNPVDRWDSDGAALVGNELLEFEYLPISADQAALKLRSGGRDRASRTIKLDNQTQFLYRERGSQGFITGSNIWPTQEFRLWAKPIEGVSRLTIAPEIGFLKIFNSDQPGHQFLIQDLQFVKTSKSNVRGIEFAMIPDRLIQDLGLANCSLELCLQTRSYEDDPAWRMFSFVSQLPDGNPDFELVFDPNLGLNNRSVTDNSRLDLTALCSPHPTSLILNYKRENEKGRHVYEFKITQLKESVDEMAVDSWLVQLFDAKGRVIRSLQEEGVEVEREYVMNSQSEIVEVIHRFVFKDRFFNNRENAKFGMRFVGNEDEDIQRVMFGG